VGLLFSWLLDVADGPDGGKRLIWVVLISKASDMGGWLVGKPFGRHKLVPSVSPGKSWEGLFGGLGASVLVAVLLASPLGVQAAAWGAAPLALFGLALGLASVAAGITQSGWKRRAGVKDSAPLIPEMGGVLDMIDSLLFAAPVAVLWFWLAP
jgi:phosphatidate cytidylyltransferase